jgi:primary-amine oxidase
MRKTRFTSLAVLWLSSALAWAAPLGTATAQATHPMDALTADEITRTVEILRQARHVQKGARFPMITLQEMEKAAVRAWKPGDPITRRAFVNVMQRKRLFEAEVDLTAGTVARWSELKNTQANLLMTEIFNATDIVKKDKGWQNAMRKRGITDFSTILCNPLAVGHMTVPGFEGHRLLNVPCFQASGVKNNMFARPIEGLMATVDLHDAKVLKLHDLGVVPVPTDNPIYDIASVTKHRKPLEPVSITAAGRNFTFNNGQLNWDLWSAHVRLDRRAGLIVSNITYNDAGKVRDVAYQLHASEMYVPYMDPSVTWSFKSYMDAGEYGLGLLASPLTPGVDCPKDALFVTGTLHDDDGKPMPMDRTICIFERATGDPLWRHYEFFTQNYEGRAEIDLVVRSAAVIGNYDYIIDYVFNAKGEINVRVGATGIDAVKGVTAQTIADASAGNDTKYGTLIAPGLSGIAHDHYVGFRLDMDVDGPENSFVDVRMPSIRLPEGNSRRSLWIAQPTVMSTEGAVMGESHQSFWKFTNPNRTNAMGNPTSYVLLPGHSARSILSPDDPPQARAAFSGELLWLTARKPEERWAAGDYSNQSQPGEGLPKYISDKQPIENTDLVGWYTVGFRHVTRAEDWPVMPTLWHSFTLRPTNFFDRNPGLDVQVK